MITMAVNYLDEMLNLISNDISIKMNQSANNIETLLSRLNSDDKQARPWLNFVLKNLDEDVNSIIQAKVDLNNLRYHLMNYIEFNCDYFVNVCIGNLIAIHTALDLGLPQLDQRFFDVLKDEALNFIMADDLFQECLKCKQLDEYVPSLLALMPGYTIWATTKYYENSPLKKELDVYNGLSQITYIQ